MKPPPLPATVQCLVHPDSDAAGKCRRCHQPFCEVCRSVWRDEVLCLACLNQVMQNPDENPAEEMLQKRQAVRSLVLAVVGWMFFIVGVGMVLSMTDGRGDRDMVILTGVVLFASFLPALFSLGQAAAAIRARGQYMTLATWSLAISGSQLGLALGVILLNASHN